MALFNGGKVKNEVNYAHSISSPDCLSFLAPDGITKHFAKTWEGAHSVLAHVSTWKQVRLSGSAAELPPYMPLPDPKTWEAYECPGPF